VLNNFNKILGLLLNWEVYAMQTLFTVYSMQITTIINMRKITRDKLPKKLKFAKLKVFNIAFYWIIPIPNNYLPWHESCCLQILSN